MEELEVVCPDCGAAYAVKPEQAGKLLHCKCGRYLVAGAKEEPEEEERAAVPEAPAAEDPEYPRTQKLSVAELTGANKQAAPAKPKPVAPPKTEPAPAAPPAFPRTERINVGALKSEAKPGGGPEIKAKAPAGPNIPPIETPVIGVKAIAPKAKPVEQPETVFEPKAAAAPAFQLDDKKKMMLGGGALLLAVIVVGAYFAMSGPKASANVPASAAATTTTSTPVSTSNAKPAAATGGCGAEGARLDNGARVSRSLLGSGMGRLEIENQGPTDISARLVNDGGLTIAWVYVQQGKSATIPTVPLGSHRLLYEAGTDWDAETLTFKCNPTFAEWDRPLEYSERRVDDRSYYGDRKVTLGKTKTPTITKDDFFKGHVSIGGPG